MRIFFADDSADERDIMAATLASGGYDQIDYAASGEELLERLGINSGGPAMVEPDLLMLDVRMPGLDGIETCARVRGDARYQHTPILMLTALDDLDTLNHAFLAGANDYIGKPYHRMELLARLRGALRLKSEMDRRIVRERELIATQEVRGLRPRDALSAIDPSTSLLPREILENYINAAGPDFQGLGAFALQIDSLAAFEKHHGAVAKRALLREVASALMHVHAHLGDLLSHFDLGLFIALLHNTNRATMTSMGRRTQQAVRDLAVPLRGAGGADIVTASIGIANDREPRALLSSAVATVERATAEGGNRILFAT